MWHAQRSNQPGIRRTRNREVNTYKIVIVTGACKLVMMSEMFNIRLTLLHIFNATCNRVIFKTSRFYLTDVIRMYYFAGH